MGKAETEPLLFEPLFRERVWGGRRLEKLFGKKLPPGKSIGESWEIVDRADAQSIVRQGELRGRTLHELWTEHRAEIFGEGLIDAPRFPIFAKLLDAREKLSLQVHPPAEVASSLGGEAKTEMWFLLEADPGAELFVGLRRGISRAQFERAIASGELARCLNRVAAKKDDVFFVPSGRLHAIGGGNLIVEIQQNSDTTYRVFDWNRRDENGQSRTLHLEDAMRAINFHDHEPAPIQPDDELLVTSADFAVEKWDLKTARRASDLREFAIFVCLSGEFEVGDEQIRRGEFFLTPAFAHEMKLRPMTPSASVLRVTSPR
ncbi:MAG TPA: type I phosphomannose isomerase catalytic subunit [Chthoniobacterales bacterium]|jgi:mannose-6-phosphate isomerase